MSNHVSIKKNHLDLMLQLIAKEQLFKEEVSSTSVCVDKRSEEWQQKLDHLKASLDDAQQKLLFEFVTTFEDYIADKDEETYVMGFKRSYHFFHSEVQL